MTQIAANNAALNTATALADNRLDNQPIPKGSDSELDAPSQGLDPFPSTPSRAELIAAQNTTAETLMYPDKREAMAQTRCLT